MMLMTWERCIVLAALILQASAFQLPVRNALSRPERTLLWVEQRHPGVEAGEDNQMSPLLDHLLNFIEGLDTSQQQDEQQHSVISFNLPQFSEMQCPSQEQMDAFMEEVMGQDIFLLSAPPERFSGMYLIRGVNRQMRENANQEFVETLNKRLASSSVASELQFFFVKNPYTKSEIMLDNETFARENEGVAKNVFASFSDEADDDVLVVTTVHSDNLYTTLEPHDKAIITASGLISVIMLSTGACAANGLDALHQAGLVGSMVLSLLTIQFAHEFAHRAISRKDKFRIDFPSLGPMGGITSLKSPPKNHASFFDFAMAGPVAGFLVSLGLLQIGLALSGSLTQLPAAPVDFIRSSFLGHLIVSHSLGPLGVAAQHSPFLPMHPLAISGFVGMILNALALLPLGNTDGGRVSTTVFGRRQMSFTRVPVLAAILLLSIITQNVLTVFAYVLYVNIVDTAGQDVPAQNEADRLDLGRSFCAIVAWCVAAATLYPAH